MLHTTCSGRQMITRPKVSILFAIAITFQGCCSISHHDASLERKERVEIVQLIVNHTVQEVCSNACIPQIVEFRVRGVNNSDIVAPDCTRKSVSMRVKTFSPFSITKSYESGDELVVGVVLQVGAISPSILYDIDGMPPRFSAVAIVSEWGSQCAGAKRYFFLHRRLDGWRIVDIRSAKLIQ